MKTLRVWWNRNYGEHVEYHYVDDVNEAKEVIKKLTMSDLVDPDVVSNAHGLEEYNPIENIDCSDDGWSEYYDEEGRDIEEIMDDENE